MNSSSVELFHVGREISRLEDGLLNVSDELARCQIVSSLTKLYERAEQLHALSLTQCCSTCGKRFPRNELDGNTSKCAVCKERRARNRAQITSDAYKRYEQALNLRESGLTYKQIGEAMNVGSVRARQLVLKALDHTSVRAG